MTLKLTQLWHSRQKSDHNKKHKTEKNNYNDSKSSSKHELKATTGIVLVTAIKAIVMSCYSKYDLNSFLTYTQKRMEGSNGFWKEQVVQAPPRLQLHQTEICSFSNIFELISTTHAVETRSWKNQLETPLAKRRDWNRNHQRSRLEN